MSNGNGVTATLSDAVDSVKSTATELGQSIASTTSDAVASVQDAADGAVTQVKQRVSKARKAVVKVLSLIHI